MKLKRKVQTNTVLRILLFIVMSIAYMQMMLHDKQFIFKEVDKQAWVNLAQVFHLQNAWSSPVNFESMNHAGAIVNVFQPWLGLYPFYLLVEWTHQPILAYYLFFIVITFVTLEVTYQVSKRLTGRTFYGVLIALAYTFALYRTFTIYQRLAFNEALSFIFLPLVLLGIHRLFYEEKPRYGALTVGFVGLMFTYPTQALMAFVVVVIFAIWRTCQKAMTKNRWMKFGVATISSAVMSSVIWVPMIQMSLSGVRTPSTESMASDSTINLMSFINRGLNNMMWLEKESQASVGIVVIFAIVVSLIAYRFLSPFERDVLGVSFMVLLLTTNIFPWGFVNKWVSALSSVWRFYGMLSLLLLFVGVMALVRLCSLDRFKERTVLLFAIVLVIFQYSTVANYNRAEGLDTYIKQEDLYTMTDNLSDVLYLPEKAAEAYTEFGSLENVDSNEANVESVNVDKNTVTYHIDTDEKTDVTLPIYAYPGEKVTCHGQEMDVTSAKNGGTKVTLAEGKHTIKVRYTYTTLTKVMALISVLSMGVGIFFLVKKGRLNHES